jgi:cellulose synthase operon protein B
MTHFRPGPNRITFEAQLHTVADAECVAGPSKGDDRFVLFDTSEFVMPDFARIARLPNLAALQGTAFPYNISDAPVALALGDFSPDIVATATTLLGRMAVAAGRIIDIDIEPASSAVKQGNAIFITTASQIPAAIPSQLDLDSKIMSTWKAPDEGPDTPSSPAAEAANGVAGNALGAAATDPNDALLDPADTKETFDRWRERLSAGGGGWRGDISSFQDWVQRTFQLSSTSLRFLPSRGAAFDPPRGSTTLIAQGPSLSGDGAWMLVTAPTSRLLREGTDAITNSPEWFQLTGRLASYNAKTKILQTQPLATFSFVPTRPITLANLRLIAANWLSENILAFSLLLFTACVLLGLATALFLSRIGRRSSA